ncbi:hypothetical protein MVEN_01726900 [Mycena venus]|uniref:Uncharacterized protein n=1 Tax=Mycena venus TaxID=2733690 RepID=A0A8H6XKL9_9AGAR|nr:hypothetical protein MVEN_01726900 [Mycena venus]
MRVRATQTKHAMERKIDCDRCSPVLMYLCTCAARLSRMERAPLLPPASALSGKLSPIVGDRVLRAREKAAPRFVTEDKRVSRRRTRERDKRDACRKGLGGGGADEACSVRGGGAWAALSQSSAKLDTRDRVLGAPRTRLTPTPPLRTRLAPRSLSVSTPFHEPAYPHPGGYPDTAAPLGVPRARIPRERRRLRMEHRPPVVQDPRCASPPRPLAVHSDTPDHQAILSTPPSCCVRLSRYVMSSMLYILSCM